MKTQIVIQINECCNQLECTFRDGVDELMLKKISTHYQRPGFNVDYGTNMVRGGLDYSKINIVYNQTWEFQEACEDLKSFLDKEGITVITWKRDIIGATLKSQVLTQVC